MPARKSVLIVVNDHQTRVDLRLFYEGLNQYVVSTATTTDALSLLQNISVPDFIITGGAFPMLSISEFLKIMKTDKRLSSIPVALIKSDKGPLEGTCCEIDMTDKASWKAALDMCSSC